MQVFSEIMSWLLVLTMVGLFAVIAGIAVAVLRLKNEAVRSAGRLSAPVKSTKNLIAAGKGVYGQESVRVKRIIKRGTVTVGVVAETVEHTRVAADGLRDIDFEAIQEHSKEFLKIAKVIGAILKAARAQGREAG